MDKGRLFVISAPSGAGKGTVLKKLLEMREDLMLSISATTRRPREGEVDGVSYFFVTRNAFLEMAENGELLEYAQYVGELYGTPKKPICDCIESGGNVILEIEVQGAAQVKAIMPEAVMIFIAPPSIEELERRLRTRGTDSEEKLVARLNRARQELLESDKYAYVVVNDDVTRAAKEILDIINIQGHVHNVSPCKP